MEIPKRLYKYRPFDKFAIASILNSELYFAPANQLNDPYDCMFRESLGEVSGIETHSLDIMRKAQGVLSFSAKSSSPTMFAHYASNHTGICMIFDPAKDQSFFRGLERVKYPPEWKQVTQQEIDDFSWPRMLFEKAPDWSYEEEWRIISAPPRAAKVDRSALVGVVQGMNMSQHDRELLTKLIEGRRLELWKARPALSRNWQMEVVRVSVELS
jgi:hypothetical protein